MNDTVARSADVARIELERQGLRPDTRTLLRCAAKGDAGNAARLLAAGVSPHATTLAGKTAIQLAAAAGHTEVVSVLLDGGARLDDLVEVAKEAPRRRDAWDKLSALGPMATVVSTLVLGAATAYITWKFNRALW